MPFNFPPSPTVGQESVQNGRNYKWTGSAWEIVTVYTDFSSNVNALLPVIANNSDNRVLTGTGSTTGINAENNLTFDGSLLNVGGSGVFTNNVIASGFVRSGGTSSQFLKGDGSVDNNSYYLNSNPSGYTTNVGTVTSVAALTLGTTGTDVSSSVANSSSTPTITLNIPSASASNRGLLTSSDWIIFNNKQPSGSYSTVGHNHNINDIINLQSSLDLKSNLNSPSFTGTPTAPTATSGTNSTQIASTAFVRNEISNLVASAPSTLDTLNELATALGNDPNFATTITNNLAGKANLSGATFTGNIAAPSGNFVNKLTVNNIDVSVSGHFHILNDITNINGNRGDITVSSSGLNWQLNNESVTTEILASGLVIDCGLLTYTAAPTDPYFSQVNLLAHFNSTNNSTTFTDSSSFNRTLTRTGINTVISTAQSKFGGSSLYLGATNGDHYLTSSAIAGIGLQDYVLEGWFYFNSLTGLNRALFGLNQDNLWVSAISNKLIITDGESDNTSGSATLLANTWHHIAWVRRYNNSVVIYCDGTATLTITANEYGRNVNVGSTAVIIGGGSLSYYKDKNFYIDDFRVTINQPRYTGSFTPPTTQFEDS